MWLAGLLLTIGAGLLLGGQQAGASGDNADPWYHWAWWLIFAGVTIVIWRFLLYPLFVALARRRTRVIRDGGLTVVIANYGPRGGEHVEVTEHVRKRLRNGRLNFAATNVNLGGDPFPEVPKSLWIKYRIHEGAPQTIQVDEGTLVVLPDEPS